ncbi:MAG: hypothetical protein Q4D91_14365 [Lautropia sp.]|nr:hypothetical protein [Lautropia sp.]
MALTIELASGLEARLHQHGAEAGRSIDDVVQAALSAYLQQAAPVLPAASAFELGKDLFGRYKGPGDLASSYRQYRNDLWGKR